MKTDRPLRDEAVNKAAKALYEVINLSKNQKELIEGFLANTYMQGEIDTMNNFIIK